MVSMPKVVNNLVENTELNSPCNSPCVASPAKKTHQGGLGLGGSVHEEAHPRFPYLIQTFFKGIDAGSIHHPLVQLIPSINHSV